MATNIKSSVNMLQTLAFWKPDAKVVDKLRGTGFDTIHILSPARLNSNLLTALIHRYNVSLGSFDLGAKQEVKSKIFLGLEDILYLTAFPIDGNAVTGMDDKKPSDTCIKYLGKDGTPTRKKTGGGEVNSSFVSLEWLRNNFSQVKDPHSELELVYRVRAYVLHVIGCVIAPQRGGPGVSVVFLPLLEEIDKIKDYAWGAALLAYLRCSIHDICKEGGPTKDLYGCSFVLMAFALERIPQLAHVYGFSDETETGKETRAPTVRETITQVSFLAGWTSSLKTQSMDNYHNHKLENFEEILDSLEADKPYQTRTGQPLPDHWDQVIIGMSRTVLVCFEHVAYHRPDTSPRQFGLENIFTFHDLAQVEPVQSTGNMVRNWATHHPKGRRNGSNYALYNDLWKRRHTLLINQGDQVEDDGESFDDGV